MCYLLLDEIKLPSQLDFSPHNLFIQKIIPFEDPNYLSYFQYILNLIGRGRDKCESSLMD